MTVENLSGSQIAPQPAVRDPESRPLLLGPLCRIDEVYRRTHVPDADRAAVARAPERTAATIAAYHRHLADDRRSLMLAWYRQSTGGPVTVISTTTTAGPGLHAPLLFPPGTRGRSIDSASVAAALEGFSWWSPIAGVVDALLPAADAARLESVAAPDPLELELLAAWHGPFAWLVLAEPVGPAELDAMVAAAAAVERDARTRGTSSPEYVLRAERLARRHLELRAGTSTGIWRVQLLAAGVDQAAAATVAGLLVSGHAPGQTPWALAPLPAVSGLSAALQTKTSEDQEQRVPFLATSARLAQLAHVPVTEIPGVRVIDRPGFDMNVETAGGDQAGAVVLGEVLDRTELAAGPLAIGRATLNRHVFVCGATGSGKSQTVRTLLEGLAEAGPDGKAVPWLVIEPAKSEYARMAGRLAGRAGVLVIRPGKPDDAPGCLNPLQPAPGFPLQTHIDLVRDLFLASFEAVEPFPQVLAHALNRCYREAGWDVVLGEPADPSIVPRYPNLADLQRTALQVVEEVGYGREVTDNVRGFIDVRIGSLRLGTPGKFFDGGHLLDVEDLLERNVVLELEDIGADQDKAFVIGAVLIRISEHLRRRATTGQVSLRHLIVIEEAHRLLKNAAPGSPAAHAVQTFAGLLAEIRAYGEGIVVAEQIPSKILSDVLKNSATKIVHQLPAQDDRDVVGATMNLTAEQSKRLVALPPGQAAVFTEGMDGPVLAAMPLNEHREDAASAKRLPRITQRSVACGTLCRARPCTLREITTADRLADDPRLTLWVELLTVAHLVGEPQPEPAGTWLDQLREGAEPRQLQCALAHRVQAAINARYTGLAVHYAPETLAAHLAEAATRRLAGQLGPGTCDGSETHWQAGRYRWADVARALTAAQKEDSGKTHPDTTAWQLRGLTLAGDNVAAQLRAFHAHPDNHLPRTVVTGVATPPAYERAAARLFHASDPVARLEGALGLFTLSTLWPITRLYPDTHNLGTEAAAP
ncbi:DNA helicase HerA-like ATPase [Catenulispora sp. GAS73]|uniref:ATP-binding protein n=1 Tax=Catenulispora sp. GAS73 TaxID=3156269 RepID=UPI003517291C